MSYQGRMWLIYMGLHTECDIRHATFVYIPKKS